MPWISRARNTILKPYSTLQHGSHDQMWGVQQSYLAAQDNRRTFASLYVTYSILTWRIHQTLNTAPQKHSIHPDSLRLAAFASGSWILTVDVCCVSEVRCLGCLLRQGQTKDDVVISTLLSIPSPNLVPGMLPSPHWANHNPAQQDLSPMNSDSRQLQTKS